jgi:type VI secretion system secreted protein VgrG
MATTQKNRMMSIATPLGEDHLLINSFRVTEALSKLFEFEAELLHEENDAGGKPTVVDAQSILGQPVTLTILQRDGTKRFFNGMVNRFSQGNRDVRFTYYYATVVPTIWKLTQKIQKRIFQHITVPDILKKVFKGYEVSFEIQGDFKPRNYCVQYRESDFDFASRLMEEEGIYYYFQHSDGSHKMIVANTPQSHRSCPGKSRLPFALEYNQQDDFIGAIKTWLVDYKLQSGKITFWDNNFQLPKNKLDAEQPSRFNVGGNQALEIYESSAGYARKYDGIDKSGGERPSDLQNVFPDKTQTAKVAMEVLDADYKTVSGTSDCCALAAGHKFTLFNHPTDEYNSDHIIVSIMHGMTQNPDYISNGSVANPYSNSFRCIAHGAGSPPFRPSRKTPRREMRGTQTATVVGPAGEEIFTDKYGRVKVQFHWDREGKYDANSSCWMRVGTLWAGKQWGVIHIPRIGQEVIVDFIEGDCDQPIIVGSVYTPDTMPPYKLPDNKTQSGVKSRSSLGGGPENFNEFRFEDKKGKEEVYLHAEKDWTIMVEHDKNQIVGHDETHLVKHDRTKTVENDETTTIVHNRTETVGSGGDKETITIHGFREETVDKDETITITGNRTEKVGKNETITIGGNRVHDVVGTNKTSVTGAETNSVAEKRSDSAKSLDVKIATESTHSGKTIKIDAGVELILTGPGGQIKIDGSGVTITGVLVKIN